MPVIIDACFVLDFILPKLLGQNYWVPQLNLLFYTSVAMRLKKKTPEIKKLATGHAKELTGLERYSYSQILCNQMQVVLLESGSIKGPQQLSQEKADYIKIQTRVNECVNNAMLSPLALTSAQKLYSRSFMLMVWVSMSEQLLEVQVAKHFSSYSACKCEGGNVPEQNHTAKFKLLYKGY